jgi:hypothetical protein
MLIAVKKNQEKTVQLRGVERRILLLKLKTAKKMLKKFMHTLMEIMSLEKIMKKSSANENYNNGGNSDEIDQRNDSTVTRGVTWRLVVVKDKKMMSRLKKKEQT